MSMSIHEQNEFVSKRQYNVALMALEELEGKCQSQTEIESDLRKDRDSWRTVALAALDQLSNMSNQLSSIESSIRMLSSQQSNMGSQLSTLNGRFSGMEGRINTLSSQVSQLKNTHRFHNHVLS